MNSIELRQKRAALVDNIKKLNAEAGGSFTTEQREKWTKMIQDEQDMMTRIQSMEAIEAQEKRDAEPKPGDEGFKSNQQEDIIEYRDALEAHMRYGVQDLTQEYRDVLEKGYVSFAKSSGGEKRNQVVGTPASGGYAVHEDQRTEIIRVMKRFSPILGHARIINSSHGGKLTMLKKDLTARSGAIITELTADSIVTQTFGQFELGAYTYTSQGMRWSLEMIQDDAFNLISEVPADGAEIIGRRTAVDFTTGDGTDKPEGVTVGASDSTVTIVADTLTFPKIEELIHKVDPEYRDFGHLMFNDDTLYNLKALDVGATDARPIWQAGRVAGEPDTIGGKPYIINQAMPDISTSTNRCILFGDFSRYIIRQVLDITVAREEVPSKRAVDFYVFARYDGKIADSSAIKYLSVA